MGLLDNITDDELINAAKKSKNKTQALRNLGLGSKASYSSGTYKKLQERLLALNIKCSWVTKTRNRETITQYKSNPNICGYCKSPIEVKKHQKISEVRKKKFCNQSCSAKFYGAIRHAEALKRKPKKQPRQIDLFIKQTKGELADKAKNYFSARGSICKHARAVFWHYYDKDVVCFRKGCNRGRRIDVSHVKAVSDFNDLAYLSEINHIDNLIGLCANCHQDFDDKVIYLNDISCPPKRKRIGGKIKWDYKRPNNCIDCDAPILKTSTRCLPCAYKTRKKTKVH